MNTAGLNLSTSMHRHTEAFSLSMLSTLRSTHMGTGSISGWALYVEAHGERGELSAHSSSSMMIMIVPAAGESTRRHDALQPTRTSIKAGLVERVIA